MANPSRYYSSNAAKTTLALSITSTSSSLELAAAANLPTQYPYTLILEKDTANEEVVEVTSKTGTAYNINRNIDNSGAKGHAIGANVEHGVSARDFTESRAHEVATTNVHGVTGDIVGTGGAQTLTSKTLTTPIINAATISGAFTSTATITGGTITGATITNLPTPTNAADAATKSYIDTQTTSAAASASAAAVSASSSATSASSSATSATSAANSATASAASASAAGTSATSAAASASSMTASVTAAATSATSAAASATAAATSATSASTSATFANDWATLTTGPVAGGEFSAKYHAQAAGTSATSAAASATAASTSATSAAASATAAATTYDDFDDRYLGSKSSAPTIDNDGNTLLIGAIYWNSTTNAMYVWSGSSWVQIATTSVYTAPTLGSTVIGSGATVTTISGLTDIVLNGPGSVADELTLILMGAL